MDPGFRVGGRDAAVLVDEGDAVSEGQPRPGWVDDLLRQQRDQAAAKLAGQKADLACLETRLPRGGDRLARASVVAATAVAENASINLKRVTAMRASNAISQKELDNARAAEREAAAKLRSAQDQLDMLTSGYREEDVLAQRAAVAAADAELNHAEIQVRDAVSPRRRRALF